MKRTKIDLSEEKRVLANMITNTSFLKGIRDIHKPSLFETSYAKVISGWVWEYYERTGVSPGRDVQDLYLRKRSEVRDEEDIELIADYLTALNENYNEIEINNVLYEVEKAETYFKLRSKSVRPGLGELEVQIYYDIVPVDAAPEERSVYFNPGKLTTCSNF